ncbi:hypothetical protein FH972_023371 [Carpinus fangiana]|uniref:SET domain-containing protein n=1 Tax=Carpinus fangiana TaxID=176857 RepID=A0A5N6KVD9_9ROSI|nr:hypothetical protein FH972_023371 [Carpinus fangiana]
MTPWPTCVFRPRGQGVGGARPFAATAGAPSLRRARNNKPYAKCNAAWVVAADGHDPCAKNRTFSANYGALPPCLCRKKHMHFPPATCRPASVLPGGRCGQRAHRVWAASKNKRAGRISMWSAKLRLVSGGLNMLNAETSPCALSHTRGLVSPIRTLVTRDALALHLCYLPADLQDPSQMPMTSSGAPKAWPAGVAFLDSPRYSARLTTEVLRSIRRPRSDVVQSQKQSPAPCSLVKIAPVADPAHPACGQHGLFAARHLPPDSFVLHYLGFVHGPDDADTNSDYDNSLDRELAIGVDGTHAGNEARFINDYRGVGGGPNAEFRDCWVELPGGQQVEKRIGVYVLAAGKSGKRAKGIGKGDEILVSYGKGKSWSRNVLNQREVRFQIPRAPAADGLQQGSPCTPGTITRPACAGSPEDHSVIRGIPPPLNHDPRTMDFTPVFYPEDADQVCLSPPESHCTGTSFSPMVELDHRANTKQIASLEAYKQLRTEQQTIRRRLSSTASTLPEEMNRSPTSDSAASTLYTAGSPTSTMQRKLSDPIMNQKLIEIDQHIKSTLTDLLNTKFVRQDSAARSWVQDQLMDTEMELKRERRRRSCCAEILATEAMSPLSVHLLARRRFELVWFAEAAIALFPPPRRSARSHTIPKGPAASSLASQCTWTLDAGPATADRSRPHDSLQLPESAFLEIGHLHASSGSCFGGTASMSAQESPPPSGRSGKRRRASYSSTSTDSSSSRHPSARHPPRRSLLRSHTATSTTSLRTTHPSLSPYHEVPSPEQSTALYHRSCELFPRPSTSSRVTSPTSPPHREPPTQPPAQHPQPQDGYFDSDPYRTSTDARPAASPLSAARPPMSWTFAHDRPHTAHHAARDRDIHLAGLPPAEQPARLHSPPQTVTYWTTPATRAEIEAQLCRAERNGLRRAWRLLAPAWLLRIKGKGLGSRGDRVCYWDGVDDGSSVRRFRVK